MALATLIYRKEPGKIGELELDLTISENHEFNTKVTDYPIEKGGNVSDHIINDPVRLSVVGFVTNTPIKVFGREESFREFGLKFIANRVQESFTLLTDMREVKEPFTVVTGLKVYRNMFFKSLIFPRNRGTGDTLRFTALLKRLRKAATKKIERQNLDPGTTVAKENTKDLAAEKIDRGTQTTTTATTEKDPELISIIDGLIFGR